VKDRFMAEVRRSVLLAGLDDALARRVVVALDGLGLQFHRAPSAVSLGDVARNSSFGVIIVAYTGEREVFARLDEFQAWSNQVGRRAAVVMLCASVLRNDLWPRPGHGISVVVPLESLETELREVVSRILGVAPRYRVQVPVRLAPLAAAEGAGAVGRTENISSSGMLLSCLEELQVGSTFRFEIAIPEQGVTIRGSARVVRAADPVREGTRGIGARFTSLADSDRECLVDLLSRHVH
jgi:hypothetical protein